MANPPRAQFVDTVLYRDPVTGQVRIPTTAKVTVYLAPPFAGAPLTTTAQIYSAETGSSSPGNPFLIPDGRIEFFAGPGSYDIVIEDTSLDPLFDTHVVRWDAIPTDAGLRKEMLPADIIETAHIKDEQVTFNKIGSGELPAITESIGFTVPGLVLIPTNNTTDIAVNPGKFWWFTATETAYIDRCIYRTHSGSVTFKIQVNGTDINWTGSSGGEVITATTSAATTTLSTPLAISTGSYVQLIPLSNPSNQGYGLAASLIAPHKPN